MKFISILCVVPSTRTYLHEICYHWWYIFIVLNLIGDHIFLWSEPQNSIACHQTLVQGLGTRLRKSRLVNFWQWCYGNLLLYWWSYQSVIRTILWHCVYVAGFGKSGHIYYIVQKVNFYEIWFLWHQSVFKNPFT